MRTNQIMELGGKPPKPKLKPGIIYSADNGRLVCVDCAGMSAKYTGRDLSGHRVTPVPVSETVDWHKEFGKPMRCEGGCTTYLLPDARPSRL
jgi:hypothetical protein